MYKIYVDNQIFCDSRIDELDIINPVVTNKVNSAGAFTFTISPYHPHTGLIKRRSGIISVYVDNDSAPVFQGICTSETSDFFNQKTYVCEGELTYFNDSIQRPAEYTNLTPRQLLESLINVHNSQVEASKRFDLGITTAGSGYVSGYTNNNTTMEAVKTLLVDVFGGFIRVRYADNKKYIDYLADSPHTSDQVIRLTENLIDYSSNIDDTEIATSIIPLGKDLETQTIEGISDRVNIKSVNNNIDYLYDENAVDNYGWVTKVVVWDNIDDPATLKAKGEAYLSEIQFENVVISAQAVDLGLIEDVDRFKVLDKIRVVSTAHGMNKYFILSEQTLNLNEPEKDTIVLGVTEQLSLTARTNENNAAIMERIEQLPTSDIMQSAIDNATALITGNEGGYVVLHTDSNGKPFEILIMDTPDIETATKVWRWNQNGFGYSSNGYSGPYGTAITMNGAIVADYITAGTLSGISIISNNATITGGSINIETSSEYDDVIKLNAGNFELDLEPSGVYLANTGSASSAYLSAGGLQVGNTLVLGNNISIGGSNVVKDSDLSSASVAYATNANHADIADKANNVTSNSHTPNCYITATNNVIFRLASGSSRRWKHDIEDVKDESLDPHKLYALPVRQFRYNEDFSPDESLQIGFIAEEVKEIYPRACEYDEEDNSAINWLDRNIIPPMLALIQEQKKQIDNLTERVERLEGLNA